MECCANDGGILFYFIIIIIVVVTFVRSHRPKLLVKVVLHIITLASGRRALHEVFRGHGAHVFRSVLDDWMNTYLEAKHMEDRVDCKIHSFESMRDAFAPAFLRVGVLMVAKES